MALALMFYWVDYKGHTKGLEWLKYYGMNSIVAYVVAQVVNFRGVVESVSYGLRPYLGDYYSAWITVGSCLIVFLILRILYKNKIFIRV